jgi:hypothetical protein
MALGRIFPYGIMTTQFMPQRYLQGLMQARRKHMERMAEVVPKSDEQSL